MNFGHVFMSFFTTLTAYFVLLEIIPVPSDSIRSFSLKNYYPVSADLSKCTSCGVLMSDQAMVLFSVSSDSTTTLNVGYTSGSSVNVDTTATILADAPLLCMHSQDTAVVPGVGSWDGTTFTPASTTVPEGVKTVTAGAGFKFRGANEILALGASEAGVVVGTPEGLYAFSLPADLAPSYAAASFAGSDVLVPVKDGRVAVVKLVEDIVVNGAGASLYEVAEPTTIKTPATSFATNSKYKINDFGAADVAVGSLSSRYSFSLSQASMTTYDLELGTAQAYPFILNLRSAGDVPHYMTALPPDSSGRTTFGAYIIQNNDLGAQVMRVFTLPTAIENYFIILTITVFFILVVLALLIISLLIRTCCRCRVPKHVRQQEKVLVEAQKIQKKRDASERKAAAQAAKLRAKQAKMLGRNSRQEGVPSILDDGFGTQRGFEVPQRAPAPQLCTPGDEDSAILPGTPFTGTLAGATPRPSKTVYEDELPVDL